MVTIIKFSSAIRRTFYYNENKLKEGKAVLLSAENYPVAAAQLTEQNRLNMLLKTAETNPKVKLSSVHISLNFAPGEQLSDDRLKTIAKEYMERIGFGQQPYLLYRHDDAGHPHVHIATVKVDLEGKRIETQNIGKNLSEPARKAIELKYGLVRAEEHKKSLFRLKPVDAEIVAYGATQTRQAIAAVLSKVLPSYKYTSLSELNALLKLYNIRTSEGSEGSRVKQHKGLLYQVLASDGTPIGTPLKASLFAERPTLKNLEKKFIKNKVTREPYKQRLQSAIDFALIGESSVSRRTFTRALVKQGIHVVYWENKKGLLYGISYIDHQSKCVFSGSDLSKAYAAKAIGERLAKVAVPSHLEKFQRHVEDIHTIRGNKIPPEFGSDPSFNDSNKWDTDNILEELMRHEFTEQAVPYQWRKKKKKKRKRL